MTLLKQAVAAFQAALQVRTKSTLPQQWAVTQHNLGMALADEAERAGVDERTRFLNLAAAAFQSALEVYTKEASPRLWANVERGLAAVHYDLGDHDRAGAEAKAANEVDPQ